MAEKRPPNSASYQIRKQNTPLIIAASLIAGLFGISVGPVSAGPICGHYGQDTDCGTIITITDAGAKITQTGQGPYDGADDTLVGVVNNSSTPVSKLTLSSLQSIFGFDGDGISSPTYGAPGNARDGTQYGGPNSYFTDFSTGTTGTVNFITSLAANGGSTFFSLENRLDNAVSCQDAVNGSVPKPAGGGTTMQASFTPKGNRTLSAAATLCGFTSFNWLQKITWPSPSPVFAANLPSGPPTNIVGTINDPPPKGGYTYELYDGSYPNGDFSYPFYCGGADFNTGGICARTATSLNLTDMPGDACLPNPDGTPSNAYANDLLVTGPDGKPTTIQALCSHQIAPKGSAIGFVTHIAGILPTFVAGTDCIQANTCIDLGIGFNWTDSFNGTAGGIVVGKNDLPLDPASGLGGITITDYVPNTDYDYNGFTVTVITPGAAVPEPSSILLLVSALNVMWLLSKRKSKRQCKVN